MGAPSFPDLDINLIGERIGKYLTLGWGEQLVFKDSLQFLASSRETQRANLLRSGMDRFKQLGLYFQVNGAAHPHFAMLLGKGVLPYSHPDAWEKMHEPALPTRDAFFSDLNNEPCREADYTRASEVWQNLNCSTLQQYLELHLKTDTLLLADIFEEFRTH